MRCLIFIEHVDGTVSDTGQELAGVAKSIGAEPHAVICARDESVVSTVAAQLNGFASATGIVDPALASYNPDGVLKSVLSVVEASSPDLVLTSYSTAGIDLAPALAHRTGRPMLGYVVNLTSDGSTLSAVSQVYGGKLLANTELPLPAVVTIMPGAVKPDEGMMAEAAPSATIAEADLGTARVRVREVIEPDTSGVNLADAEKIFCVGRALGGTEKLTVAEELATSLGAELAGSRPVIDAGWMPKACQVGKSGTKVKPKLYLMAGVSGAPEHLEGMASSELIIALNSDEQAPIFNKAHYGAVCDMFQVIPALIERLQAGK